MNESLGARLPALFNDDDSTYVVVIKPTDLGFAVEQRISFNGIGPTLIGTQEALVWKVAPGGHFVTYAMWIGGGTMRVEALEGDRVIVVADGGGTLSLLSFYNERENIRTNLRLKSYFDIAQQSPPEPPRRRRN